MSGQKECHHVSSDTVVKMTIPVILLLLILYTNGTALC